MNVVIIGCGLVGRKRAASLGRARLLACADRLPEQAAVLAAAHPGCIAYASWEEALAHPGATIAIIATTHDSLAAIAAAAIRAGLHLLLEKPGARTAEELRPLADLAQQYQVKVQTGYNHRFHPALRLAHDLAAAGKIGQLTHLRASYGHGGRPGYEGEWRHRLATAGGGELLDQGSHLIDLAAWYLGPATRVSAILTKAFWQGEVEDNAFLLLQTASGGVAQLHASWTEWKNRFSLELFGATGKIEITGLGRSYGPECLTLYTMRPEMGPPDVEHWEFPEEEDQSWRLEFEAFLSAIAEGREPEPGLAGALHVLDVVGKAYAQDTQP